MNRIQAGCLENKKAFIPFITAERPGPFRDRGPLVPAMAESRSGI